MNENGNIPGESRGDMAETLREMLDLLNPSDFPLLSRFAALGTPGAEGGSSSAPPSAQAAAYRESMRKTMDSAGDLRKMLGLFRMTAANGGAVPEKVVHLAQEARNGVAAGGGNESLPLWAKAALSLAGPGDGKAPASLLQSFFRDRFGPGARYLRSVLTGSGGPDGGAGVPGFAGDSLPPLATGREALRLLYSPVAPLTQSTINAMLAEAREARGSGKILMQSSGISISREGTTQGGFYRDPWADRPSLIPPVNTGVRR